MAKNKEKEKELPIARMGVTKIGECRFPTKDYYVGLREGRSAVIREIIPIIDNFDSGKHQATEKILWQTDFKRRLIKKLKEWEKFKHGKRN